MATDSPVGRGFPTDFPVVGSTARKTLIIK